MQTNTSNTQSSTKDLNNSNYSNDEKLLAKAKANREAGQKTLHNIKDTPFKIVSYNDQWTLALGQQIITTKTWEKPAEAQQYVKTWDFMCELILTMIHMAKQYDQHTAEIIKEENLQPETDTFVNQKHNEYPPHGA